LVYCHIDNKHQTKLDSKSNEGIMVGYDSHTKGYLIYDKEHRIIKISIDIRFKKQIFPYILSSWTIWLQESIYYRGSFNNPLGDTCGYKASHPQIFGPRRAWIIIALSLATIKIITTSKEVSNNKFGILEQPKCYDPPGGSTKINARNRQQGS
jgi:hypothetical protein